MPIQLILILGISLILVLFTFQNPHPVQMQFMAWQTKEFPLIALILVSALFGVIAAAFLSLKNSLQLKQTIRQLRMELESPKTPPSEPEVEEEAVGKPDLAKVK
ncbi:MAG: LapA family protein [Elusimicrobia bacterium]|nr:LapA family protein [Candidatus Obscuribacterium magneticum]